MKIGSIRLFVLLGLLAIQSGAAEPLGNLDPAYAGAMQDFTLGPGDVVGISVWNHKELSMEIAVHPGGEISYPMLGRVDANGMTLRELEEGIRKALSRYLKDPQVSANLVSSANSFAVVGEVQKPGYYEIKPGCQLAEAIACAGGLTENALSNDVTLVRQDNEVLKIDLDKVLNNAPDAQKVELRRGDLLMVPKIKLRVSVLGEVSKPGLYDMTRPSAKLTDAIATAGGVTKRSKASRIGIVRYSGESPALLEADLGAITRNGTEQQNIQLCDGDMIYVPGSNKLNWNEGLQAILGIASLASLVK